MSQALLERGVEGDGVERHADVHRSGELGAHASHAFAGGALALVGLALDDQHVFAAGGGEVPGDAGAHDAAADDDHVRCVHAASRRTAAL
jgi:hypothetical protein